MPQLTVRFTFCTGLRANIFRNARLAGSWDAQGRRSTGAWSILPMAAITGDDGCPAFATTVQFDASLIGTAFDWGVLVDRGAEGGLWAIAAERDRHDSQERHRVFTLRIDGQHEVYHLCQGRRLGANKTEATASGAPGIRFAVWAPNAREVSVVFADTASGYIGNDGAGVLASPAPIALARSSDGVWSADSSTNPTLGDFTAFLGRAYMFRLTKDDGSIAYRTDLFSRRQIGSGAVDPANRAWSGEPGALDGTVSCSVVVDPELVEDSGASVSDLRFWRDEVNPARPVSRRVEDLVIYELHVGALGFGRADAGTLEDAIALVPHLAELGVNAVELLPISEFRGAADWGYSTSHFCAVEGSAGGADALKRFVRACHRHGIAVILDVVYNHYHHDAERAEWAYDSNAPERNVWYWYEGHPGDYPRPDGGYIDNMSTGWAPRYHEEIVRQLFIASAAAFLTEFHIDGFRVDQTTSMHAYAVVHADGRAADHARIFGQKFLRQWARTLRLIKPDVMLMAEDHSGWPPVTRPTDEGGLGFDATWYAAFYHHLVGDGEHGPEYAKLLTAAAYADRRPLAMSYFAGALYASRFHRIVYNESHDEAGNAKGSARTLCMAVGCAPLIGETRRWAEARSRFAAGMTVLSAGTPMFFMGEEIGATKPYRYTDFAEHKEDLVGEKERDGRALFAFYRDLVRLRRGEAALASRNVDILHVNDIDRVIAFRRWRGHADGGLLIVASLNERAFDSGYFIRNERLPDGLWREIFNSDAERYGGWNTGNRGRVLAAEGGALTAVLPASGFVVLRHAPA